MLLYLATMSTVFNLFLMACRCTNSNIHPIYQEERFMPGETVYHIPRSRENRDPRYAFGMPTELYCRTVLKCDSIRESFFPGDRPESPRPRDRQGYMSDYADYEPLIGIEKGKYNSKNDMEIHQKDNGLTLYFQWHARKQVDKLIKPEEPMLKSLKSLQSIYVYNAKMTVYFSTVLINLAVQNARSLETLKFYQLVCSNEMIKAFDATSFEKLIRFQFLIFRLSMQQAITLLEGLPDCIEQISIGNMVFKSGGGNGERLGQLISGFKNLKLLHIYYLGDCLLLDAEFVGHIRKLDIKHLTLKDVSNRLMA